MFRFLNLALAKKMIEGFDLISFLFHIISELFNLPPVQIVIFFCRSCIATSINIFINGEFSLLLLYRSILSSALDRCRNLGFTCIDYKFVDLTLLPLHFSSHFSRI